MNATEQPGVFAFITPAGTIATVDELAGNPAAITHLNRNLDLGPTNLRATWSGERNDISYITSTIIANEKNRYQRHLKEQQGR